jgi:hypothetical protein
MQFKPLLIGFCLLLTFSSVQSQLVIGAKKQQKVILFSGDTIQSDSITYEFLNSDKPYFRLGNGTQFTSDSVKFVTNFHGTFVNLREVGPSNDEERYALRIRNKKVKVFEEIEMEIYGREKLAIRNIGKRISQHPELASGDEYDFYTLRNDTVRKVNYQNLKIDLWGNEKSRDELLAFKRFRYLQVGMIAAGAGIAVASLYMGESTGKITPITATGIILAGCSVLIEFPKKDALKNAIDFYD